MFFPGEVNYFYYFASELVLCNNSSDTIFSPSKNYASFLIVDIFHQHPFQPQELSEAEVNTILDVGDIFLLRHRLTLRIPIAVVFYGMIYYSIN